MFIMFACSITVKKKRGRSCKGMTTHINKHVNWPNFLPSSVNEYPLLPVCARNVCHTTCICAHERWGWIAVECVRADLQGSAAQRMAEWCSPPGRRCTSNTQTPAYFTNKRWLVCSVSAPPQINNINALQILVFSLITKLGALRLNPQHSLRMETAGCVCVCVCVCVYIKPITL